MATIGCARQRHDSAVNRIEKLKSQSRQQHEIRAESDVAPKIKPKNAEFERAREKILVFLKPHSERCCGIKSVHF
jgi:hypothetical protein